MSHQWELSIDWFRTTGAVDGTRVTAVHGTQLPYTAPSMNAATVVSLRESGGEAVPACIGIFHSPRPVARPVVDYERCHSRQPGPTDYLNSVPLNLPDASFFCPCLAHSRLMWTLRVVLACPMGPPPPPP
ncbi:unnamed protein product [Haemonchus placei]|uniref:Uncharacterized protein n=1 Tax=Haemonchus placei TaxID=6290 RepID=A0A0N4WHB5_HAEPC|nr:unnamed protein product [Haemonchus placei]